MRTFSVEKSIPMSNETNIQDEIGAALEESNTHLQKLKDTINGVLEALSQRGVRIQVDFDTSIRGVQRSLGTISKKTKSIHNQFERMAELQYITALLTSSLDLDFVLEQVMDTVIRLTGAERAYLMIDPKGGDDLQVQVARNWSQESISQKDVTFSQGVITAAIQSGEPVITNNAAQDARFEANQSVMNHQLRSIIVIPLVLKEQIIGVLYADNRIGQGVFSLDDVPILSAFANQAAIAISNARLFEQVKDDLEEARQKVAQLQIQIDQQRVMEEVTTITDNEFFEQLSQKVEQIRAARRPSSE
jgi:GAF domain-containing protein